MTDATPDQPAVRADIDFFAADFLQCPYPALTELRRRSPIAHVPAMGSWVITDRTLIREAMNRHEDFSSRFGTPQTPPSPSVAAQVAEIASQGWPLEPTLLTEDPPAHDYYRRLVSRAFAPRFVAATEPMIRDLANTLLADIDRSAPAPVEFVVAFAAPYPLTVIARILGVEESRLPDFRIWSDEFVRSIGATIPEDDQIRAARRMLEFQQYFAAEMERLRESGTNDTFLGRLVHAHDFVEADEAECGDEPLRVAAGLSIIQQLLVAGNETTTKTLTEAVYQLASNPEVWAWFKEDPEGRSAAVAEEAIRILTPVQMMLRVTTSSIELGGVAIPAASPVLLCFGAANHDAAVFQEPEAFLPWRENNREHLAFGHGVHYCLGAQVAMLQLRVALEELARRFARIELLSTEPQYVPSFMLRGLARLDVAFHVDA